MKQELKDKKGSRKYPAVCYEYDKLKVILKMIFTRGESM